MRPILLSIFLVLVLLTSSWALPQPQEQLQRLVQSVLETLRSEELNIYDKKSRVSRLVQENLCLASMARRTLGTFWTDATEEDRQRFQDLFVQVLEGTYLDRLDAYADGEVTFLRQRVRGTRAIVDTLVSLPGANIPVQYKMVLEGERWQVFDVVIDGVSLIRNYQASYREIIRSHGLEGLLALMAERIVSVSSN